MASANPPPIRVPRSLLGDPDAAGFFREIITAIQRLYVRTGGGVDLIETMGGDIEIIENITVTQLGASTTPATTSALANRVSHLEAGAVSARQQPTNDWSAGALMALAVRAPASVAEGTWTPTLTAVANVDAVTASLCGYAMVGGRVYVDGVLSVDATLVATLTEIGISLPIASEFGSVLDAAGVATSPAINGAGGFNADTANNRLNLYFTPTDVGDNEWYFSGSYRRV
jgi:hypothetical protein